MRESLKLFNAPSVANRNILFCCSYDCCGGQYTPSKVIPSKLQFVKVRCPNTHYSFSKEGSLYSVLNKQVTSFVTESTLNHVGED